MTYQACDCEDVYDCETLEDALKICNETIKIARRFADDGWPDWVYGAWIKKDGELFMKATETNKRGPDGIIDSDGLDESGLRFNGVEYYCDIEMKEVEK